MNDSRKLLTIQEKIKKGLIKTPLKKLNRHFNFSYVFKVPTREEKDYMERKVQDALRSKSKASK